MKRVFTDEFKLSVIEDYYCNPFGVRAVALKYNLPSKNYINKWEEYLKKKGLLPLDSTKPYKAAGRSPESLLRNNTKTNLEKQYEAEIQILNARIEYLEGLESIKPFLKKKPEKEK